MSKILLRASISACAIFTALTAWGAAPPKLRLQEQQKIEPLSYRADLTLDPVKDSFTGSLLIRLQVSESTNTIWLNAHHLSIASITLTSGENKLTGKATPAGEDFVGIAFDTPMSSVVGAARPYAQTLERIDLCIALKKAQAPSVAAFLQSY